MLYQPGFLKFCRCCNTFLFPTTKNFPRDKSESDGLYYKCKVCVQKYTSEHKEDRAKYLNTRKERDSELKKRWYANNAEYARAYSRGYHNKHRIKQNEKSKEYQRKHPEEKRRRRHQYYITHKLENRIASHERRAKLKRIGGIVTPEDINRLYKAQKGKCYWCGCKVGKNYHVDHVIPLDRGGSNDPGNLVITCPFCNLSKNNKLPHEWNGNGGKLL